MQVSSRSFSPTAPAPGCSVPNVPASPPNYNRGMRYALLLAALPALFAADLKIDHATVAGTDVRKMQANLQALGIATVYGGAHSNHATEMALVSFPDGSYLEVMGIQPG